MYAVFAVCKQHCLARAKRLTKWRVEVEGGGTRDLSPEEWEVAVQALAAELFEKSKPKKISPIFEAKGAAIAFKDLAERTREGRALSIKRRDHLLKHGVAVLNKKTKRPRLAWVVEC